MPRNTKQEFDNITGKEGAETTHWEGLQHVWPSFQGYTLEPAVGLGLSSSSVRRLTWSLHIFKGAYIS